MDEKLTELSFYWTDPFQRYVLERTQVSRGPRFNLYDLRLHGYAHFEEVEVFQRIVNMMIDAGVPVFDDLPDRGDPTMTIADRLIGAGFGCTEANRHRRDVLEREWQYTDGLLKKGEKYPEICEIRAAFVAREIKEKLRSLGVTG